MKKILIEDSLLLIVLSVLLSTAFLLLTNTVIYLINDFFGLVQPTHPPTLFNQFLRVMVAMLSLITAGFLIQLLTTRNFKRDYGVAK